MIELNKMYNKIYIDFQGLYYPILFLGKIYTTILLDAKLLKT